MNRDSVRLIQLGVFGWAANAAHSAVAISSNTHDLSFARKVFADHVIFRIGDNDIAEWINAQMFRSIHRGLQRIAAVSRSAFFSRSDNSSNFSRAVHHAKCVATPFEYIDVSFGVDRDCPRINEGSIDGLLAIFWNPFFAVTGHSSNHARFQINQSDTAIVQVSEVKSICARAKRRAIQSAEFCILCRTAITTESLFSSPCDRRDHAALRLNFADAIIPCIAYEHVTIRQQRQRMRAIKQRIGGWPSVACVAFLSIACHFRENSLAIHFAEPITWHLDDVHIAIVVEIDTEWPIELRFKRQSARKLVASSSNEDQFGNRGVR